MTISEKNKNYPRKWAQERNTVSTTKWYKNETCMTAIAALIQLAMIVVIMFLLLYITENLEISALGALVTWAIVFFKTPFGGWFFVRVKGNHAIVLRNELISDKVPKNMQARTILRDEKAWREVGPGFQGKFPFEAVVQGVNTESEIVIGATRERPLECTTADNTRLYVTYQVKVTPLRGFLVNLVRQSEDAVIAQVRGEFEQFILHWVKGKTEDEVFRALADLQEQFKSVLGGPGIVVLMEEQLGVFTNEPQITSVSKHPKYAEAAEGQKTSGFVANSVETILNSFVGGDGQLLPGIDPNLVLVVAAANSGQKIGDAVIIPGLGGSDNNAAAILAAATRKKP